ncbi:low affinity immunoglobulin gamma Fc region receptor II-like [Hippoglossus stenolepis]|uniref:low affinity immunoglobulin gamma Fc region receptor II-like n=1 Tax=Hippoglossus stenolepis TaxID=195615 RepID=UPI00159C57D3|nr:low affinity immunoglobulin gamma Fc region receptor II-like [Hippoglossus stenolepis]
MKSVSLLLGLSVLLLSGLTVSAVSLSVSPNLQQFFSKDSVSLSCVEGGQTGGQIMKRTAGGQTGGCGQNFETMNGSSCSFPHLSCSDSGVYWCETSDGQKSQQVNISVRDDPVILQIPALPVHTGSDVTLRCKSKNGYCETAYFFRDKVYLSSELEEKWIVRDVRRTDEGNYSCSTETYESPHSWLRVAAPPPPPSSVFRLFCLLVVVCLFCICSVIMMSRCCSRMTENKSAVSMEMTPCVEEYDYITADVITHHDV